MNDVQKGAIVFLILIAVFLVIIILNVETRKSDCIEIGKQAGRQTEYRRGECFMEIAPDLWVRKHEVIYYLDHIEQKGK